MRSTTLLVTLFAIVSAVSKISLEEKIRDERFQRYVSLFEKNYQSDEEYAMRKVHFEASMKRAAKRNARSNGKTQFGATKFSDLSAEEFKRQYLTSRVPAYERKEGIKTMEPQVKTEDMPTSLDFRKNGWVTPVKDQGQCGSCWAQSVTENIESKWIMKGNAKAADLALSVQQIVDCDGTDAGCNGGNPGPAYDYVISAGGLVANKTYPYRAVDQTCAFQNNDSVVAKISSWQYATSWYSESELQQNLVSWGPLSVCVDAASWQDYKSGVLTWTECAWINLLDHCVQLVGYNTDATGGDYWIVRNSWGTDWGLDGYIWIQRGEDACGIAHQATSAFI